VSKQSAERPILFQTEMVKAILEGRKTQTRRGFNQASYLTNPTQRFKGMGYINGKPDQYAASIGSENFSTLHKSKYGKPGDLLWVRERFHLHGYTKEGSQIVSYKSQAVDSKDKGWTWKPSIHMPKSAARIWLMVEDIRVERLNDIREDDARNEGVLPSLISTSHTVGLSCKYSFAVLWESINGKESWNSNPWVWVIQFRVLSTTGKPTEEVIEQNFKEIAPLRFEMGQIRNEIENTVLFKGRKEASHV